MIEQGKRKPDWFTFSNIMKKLEVDPSQYFSDIASEDELFIYNKINVANQLLGSFDYEGVKAELDKLEEDERFEKGLGYQVLLGYRTILYSQEKYVNPELALKYAYEYIRLTRPDFEVEQISSYFLSENDFKAINRLAVAYYSSGNSKKAIAIRYLLVENYEKNYSTDIDNNLRDTYIIAIANIARALVEEEGQFEEGMAMAEKGLALLKGSANIWLYIRFLYHKAYALLHLGRKQEGEELFKRCLMFSYAMGEDAPLDMAVAYQKNEFVKHFGYEIGGVVAL